MQQIATAARRALDNVKTGSGTLSGKCPAVRRELAPPTTIEEEKALRAWALTLPTVEDRLDPGFLADQMAFMDAALPSRDVDVEQGRLRATAYFSALSAYPDEAIAFMARKAVETCKFFPTPSECLAILKSWTLGPSTRERALTLCRKFNEERFDRWKAAIRERNERALAADVPDQWRRILEAEGLLRLMEDGSFQFRAKPVASESE